MTEKRVITEAEVLKALTQPIRRRLFRLLAHLGPSTVGTLAKKVDADPGQISYHLRALAKLDLIEEAPELARDRRERVYRRPDGVLSWSRSSFADEDRVIVDALKSELISDEFERALAWERDRDEWPAEWRDVATSVQSHFVMTPRELQDFEAELQAVYLKWGQLTRDARDAGDTEGRERVFHFTHSFPEHG
ncbi:transcriptional regulator [Actinorhabdospora filicis]|uniref:Transcriptional regulator n=1 Tax=Actinorhabdospora filicis TaxID=1785913 RepID=A0A9W6SGK0_9ACTN|nr:helix-turn-helix domain-containing protein [Actinorhabdospora filicis]GLZ75615.1 transcriptional regulator [Actinorhabdospora filicis]